MIASMHPAQVGRWYLRWDRNEIFQVTGRDSAKQKIQIRTYAGDDAEIAEEAWDSLQLGLADPPSDWSGPVETVDEIDLDSASGESAAHTGTAHVRAGGEGSVSEYVAGPYPGRIRK